MLQEVSQQNLQSDSLRDVLKVTLLGGGWNLSAGGLATFNRELAVHLSQHPKVKVSFLVPDGHCTEKDRREAHSYGITVVDAKKQAGFDPLDWLGVPPESHQMDVVIGHGAKLGKQVQFIKEFPRFHNCKWVQVVHTAPEDLSKYKGYPDPIPKGEDKHEVEVDLCKRADLVVPVGPRLEEVYLSYLQRCKSPQDVFSVIPGLFDREFGDLQQSSNENAQFKVLLCGRGDEEDFELKGYDIAVKAFTDNRLKGKRHHLVFVGASEGKQGEVRKRLRQGGITDDQLTVRKFIQSREKMKDLLCEVDLAIMPSKSEGYGLVALEALSAGLPILVSSRSGFARALKNIPFGDSCIVDSDEPAKWAEAIEGVGVRHSVRLEEMKKLRKSYGKRYSWKNQCDNLVEKLWAMVNDEKLLQMNNEVKDIKEKLDSHFQNRGTAIRGQDISQKLTRITTNIETSRKESKVQVDISAKLEQMRSEIESVREEVDTLFRTTTQEIRRAGAEAEENRHDDSPPQLSFTVPTPAEIPANNFKEWSSVDLPIDILLLTVKDCEFLSCFCYLEEPFKSYHKDIGCVYFGSMGKGDQEKLKVALMICSESSNIPGGSLIVAKAFKVLQPKAVFSVGICSGLNSEKVKLGDIVVVSKLITPTSKTPVSRDTGNLSRHAGFGWKPPLKNPDERQVTVYRDGVIVGQREGWKYEDIIREHPEAHAVETESEGLFTAAYVDKVEWMIVKGVASYGDPTQSSRSEWASFASTMAASVVASTILKDPAVFKEWPHYNEGLKGTENRYSSVIGRQLKDVRGKSHSLKRTVSEAFGSASTGPSVMDIPQNVHPAVKCKKIDDVKATGGQSTSSGKYEQDGTQLQAAIQRLKANIKTETEQSTDLQQPFRPNPGEGRKPKDLKIDQIYVNVVIHEDRVNYDFPTDRWEQLKVYPKPNTDKSMCVPPRDVIDDKHKNVLVVGRPGIGKTMMSTKLLRTWASDDTKMQEKFEVAFLLKFRHLNNETDPLSLHELLARAETVESLDGEIWKCVIENPTKVLLIFDGIDEFLARSDISKDDSRYKNGLDKKMPLHALYRKLASGKLLCGATVITTTRPTAAECLNKLTFDRTVEILGFTSEQVEEYVENFTKDDQTDDAKTTIWEHISTNVNLFSLCYIPVNCFIICHCLLQIINICTGTARKLPSKITDIYSMHVKIFFFKHNRNDKYSRSTTDLGTYIYKKFDDLQPENDLVFKKLGEMAFNGIKERRLVFESSEVGDLQDCGLLHRLPDVKSRKLSEPPKPQFCFTHLTVQEFFAAKHLTDTMNKGDLQRFVASRINHGAWQVVMQFVAGLLEPDADQGMSNIDIFADLLPTSTREQDTWIVWPANDQDKRLALNVCKCLFELEFEQQNSLQHKTAEIGFNALDFSRCSLGPVDCIALTHFVKNSNIAVECLNFSWTVLGSLSCREICDLLKDENCTTLNLSYNDIGEQGAAYLCDALKDVNCNLTTLDLNSNHIGEQGAAYLCVALKDVNCNLTTLNIGYNNIGKQGAAYLCDALKDVNCNLTTLNLKSSDIGEQGAAHLCDALKDVNCKLTTLDLRHNLKIKQGEAVLRFSLSDVNCTVRW